MQCDVGYGYRHSGTADSSILRSHVSTHLYWWMASGAQSGDTVSHMHTYPGREYMDVGAVACGTLHQFTASGNLHFQVSYRN
jgi:hypothetical protein